MNKNLLTILLLTVITLLAWGAFQLFRIRSESTITPPTAEQIRELNPTIDKSLLNDLKEQQ
jgi:hypothetical protein